MFGIAKNKLWKFIILFAVIIIFISVISIVLLKNKKKYVWDNFTISEILGVDIPFKFKTTRINIMHDDIVPGELFISIQGNTTEKKKIRSENAIKKGAIFCIVDDDSLIHPKYIHINSCSEALIQLAKHRMKNSNGKVIAITGSIGKTSVKEMIYSILCTKYTTCSTSGNYNNLIGLPNCIINMNNDCEYIVVEMGMREFGEISKLTQICQPTISAITWIGESHIGNFKSNQDIALAKSEIFDNMKPNSVAVIPEDNEYYAFLKNISIEKQVDKTVAFGKSVNRVKIENNNYVINIFGNDVVVPKKIIENHFLNNVLLVFTVGVLCNVPASNIINVLNKHEKVDGRGNIIKCVNGVTIIDDSYNASPTSVKLSLLNLSKQKKCRKIAVLGEMKELGVFSKYYHEELIYFLNNIDILVTFGKDMKILHDILYNNIKLQHIHFNSLDELLSYLKNTLQKNDVVLIKGSASTNISSIVSKLC